MAEYSTDSREWLDLAAQIPASYPWLDRLHFHDTVTSTNDLAKSLAQNGAPQGTVVLARSQTAGRGRMGRSFHSPMDQGIYLSLILRPNCPPTQLMHLTCAVALAVQTSLHQLLEPDQKASRIQIKWINDLVIGRKKVAGILTELSLDARTGLVSHAILGIGVNCSQGPLDFPEELRDKATSLGCHFPIPSWSSLVGAILQGLWALEPALLTRKDWIMDQYRSRCMTLGQSVSIHGPNTLDHGKALDVDPDGALVVEFDDGHIEAVSAGEVSVRGMYGYL